MKRAAAVIGAIVIALASCRREARLFRDSPPSVIGVSSTTLSDLQPGMKSADLDVTTKYEGNAYAISEGKKLYESFNCVGCHAHGGGAMGPPLMDDEWIYGSDPENIYSTIVQGRPNGMPAWGGRIPSDRIWWIVAYVRSMSGLTPKNARTGRDDDMMYGRPPQRKKDAEKTRDEAPRSAQQ